MLFNSQSAIRRKHGGFILKRVYPCLLISLLIGALLLSGCGRKSRVRPPAAVSVPGRTQVGTASWYGRPYHGRPTASGEIYDMEKLTAAHRTLPFGTRVKVENLENHQSVDLRINDRGPFVEDRIIDVSRAAARVLVMLGTGTAKVRLEVLTTPDLPAGDFYAVQLGAFQDRGRADRLRREMKKKYGTATLTQQQGSLILWRVLVGRVGSIEAAESLARRIRAENRVKAGAAFVVHLD